MAGGVHPSYDPTVSSSRQATVAGVRYTVPKATRCSARSRREMVLPACHYRNSARAKRRRQMAQRTTAMWTNGRDCIPNIVCDPVCLEAIAILRRCRAVREHHLGCLETEKKRGDCYVCIPAEADYSYFRFTSIPHFVGIYVLVFSSPCSGVLLFIQLLRGLATVGYQPAVSLVLKILAKGFEKVVELQSEIPKRIRSRRRST